MSNAASAASWMLKQFRIPFDVKIHIDNVFAKNINMIIYIFILSNQFKVEIRPMRGKVDVSKGFNKRDAHIVFVKNVKLIQE